MMPGLTFNKWSVSKDWAFKYGITPASDSFVLGKLSYSEQKGLFKNPTALARVVPNSKLSDSDRELLRETRGLSIGLDAYVNKTPIRKFKLYYSKTALHGFFYSIIDYVINPDPEAFLKFIILQKVVIFSLVIAFLIYWISRVFGLFSALFVLISIMMSPIITTFSRSYYFVPYTFFLPFVAALYMLSREYDNKLEFGWKQYLLLGILFLWHMCFHTFEFISTFGIASVTPFIYFGLLKQNIGKFFQRLFKIGATYFVSILIGLTLLVFQYMNAKQTTVSKSFSYVVDKFELRSGSNKTFEYKIANAKNENQRALLRKLKSHADYSNWKCITLFLGKGAIVINDHNKTIFRVSYKFFFRIFFVSSFLLLILSKGLGDPLLFQKSYALIISFIFSISAPLSWFMIFTQHSVQHQFFVEFVWFLPTMILGWCIVGFLLELIKIKVKTSDVS